MWWRRTRQYTLKKGLPGTFKNRQGVGRISKNSKNSKITKSKTYNKKDMLYNIFASNELSSL